MSALKQYFAENSCFTVYIQFQNNGTTLVKI